MTGGKQISIDELARRAAKRRNRKIAERYPMFAEQFATTVEEQKERIIKQREFAREHMEKIKKSSIEAWQRGLELREIARRILPSDRFEFYERVWQHWHSDRSPEYSRESAADHWFQALRGTQWAFENCPNIHRHNDPVWWRPHWHHLFEKFVETTECPTCGMPRPDL